MEQKDLHSNVEKFLEELRTFLLKKEVFSMEIYTNSFEYGKLIELADDINIGLCISASNHFYRDSKKF